VDLVIRSAWLANAALGAPVAVDIGMALFSSSSPRTAPARALRAQHRAKRPFLERCARQRSLEPLRTATARGQRKARCIRYRLGRLLTPMAKLYANANSIGAPSSPNASRRRRSVGQALRLDDHG